MTTKRFKVNKLVRDKLPDMMQAQGIIVHERVMDQIEFVQKLKEKLLEEGEEVKQSQSLEDLKEELADILEIIHTLSSATGLSMQHIEEKRIEKRLLKGGFERKVFVDHVDIEEDNPAIKYFLNKCTSCSQGNNQSHKESCLFCEFAGGKREVALFAEFQHCYIIKDQFPVSPGHLLIIPYEHTENWFTATEEVRLDILKALSFAKERLDYEYAPHGYNIGANCGEVAGQTIMHLHVHLIPRYKDDMEDPKGGVRGVIPSKQKY